MKGPDLTGLVPFGQMESQHHPFFEAVVLIALLKAGQQSGDIGIGRRGGSANDDVHDAAIDRGVAEARPKLNRLGESSVLVFAAASQAPFRPRRILVRLCCLCTSSGRHLWTFDRALPLASWSHFR